MPSKGKQKENYECIMEIMNVPVLEGLREIFKQEWDKQYGVAIGVWDDTCISGNELYNMEKAKPKAKDYLQSFKAGNRSNWDSSALSYAILYSKALKTYIPPHVTNNVDVLRDLRNKLVHDFGSKHAMPDAAFQNVYKKIENCLIALSLSPVNINSVRHSRERRTLPCVRYFQYFVYVCSTMFILVLFYWWLQKPVENKLLFKVLPTRPAHLIANRSQTVNGILDKLHNLSITNNRALTYMYISGPAGSGKSQIARLVGQQYDTYFSHDWFGGTTFVMTINGRSLLHVLNSYFDFAYNMNCDKSTVDAILNSAHTKVENIVRRLQLEIIKKLQNGNNKYTWLMIVNNVLKLSEISQFLPQLEDKNWQGGQVLILTQDISSVLSNSPLTLHISVDQGMDTAESCKFLTDLSGVVENEDLVAEVAKQLDHQPLALVSAALYAKQLRESSEQFAWNDYLKKLEEERRRLTKMKQSESKDANYSTMHAAVSLAIRWIGENDSVLKNAFVFFSYVSHDAIPFYSLHAFVLHVDQDAFNVVSKIQQCFLILSSENSKISSVFVHSIVHQVIKLYIAQYAKEDNMLPRIVLQMLVLPKLPFLGDSYLPHLKAFYNRAKNLPMDMLIPKLRDLRPNMYNRLLFFAHIFEEHGELSLFSYYKKLSFRILSETN